MTGKMSVFQKILKHKYLRFMISPRNNLDAAAATVSLTKQILTEEAIEFAIKLRFEMLRDTGR